MSNPSISIITACFNSEETIRHTILSANMQSYQNIQHVFVDGSSSDQTLDIIKRYSRLAKVVISEPDEGIYDALNKGVRAATGEVIGFLHADDFYPSPYTLELVASRFCETGVAGVYGDLQYVSRTNIEKIIRHWKTRQFSLGRLRRGWMPPHPTLFVRRSWYKQIGYFDARYRIAGDYFSMLQLFKQPEFHTAYVPEVLVKMRVGGESNASLRSLIRKTYEDYDALKRSGVGGLGTLAAKSIRKVGQFL